MIGNLEEVKQTPGPGVILWCVDAGHCISVLTDTHNYQERWASDLERCIAPWW